MGNQDVVEFCRTRLAEGKEPENVCEELLDKCLAPDCELSGLGCDNMTAILVCLMQGASNEEYLAKLSREPPPLEAEDFESAPFGGENKKPLHVDTPPTPIEELFSTPSQSPIEDIPDDEKPPTEFRVVAADEVPIKDEVNETPA
ncbi:putative protein phosphatase 2C [Aphelenchoides avenae]|nr:putative protein phosphatase 2C [Aphelenchus avenae]